MNMNIIIDVDDKTNVFYNIKDLKIINNINDIIIIITIITIIIIIIIIIASWPALSSKRVILL